MRVNNAGWMCALALAMTACGGGGGAGSSPSTPVVAPAKLEYPVLTTGGDFTLATLTAPPERTTVAGTQRGQALGLAGVPVPGGLAVELLDASTPANPRVLATAVTTAGGSFVINAAATTTSSVTPADLWLRLTLVDGSTLRAWASGWTEITPGTEAAVREVARLRKAGALSSRAVTMSELAAAQESLSLLWLGRPPAETAAASIANLLSFARTHAPWNDLLDRLSSATPVSGAGDIAGLMPVGITTWPSSVVSNRVGSSSNFASSCLGSASLRNCTLSSSTQPDLTESFDVQPTGIRLRTDGSTSDALSALFTQLGPLDLIEFPHAVGSRVLVDNPRFVLALDSNVRASVKITRRTYPAGAVQALGGAVQAVQVVLDYEIALLNYTTQKQVDVLAREQRWFSPQGGRVRVDFVGTVRADGVLTVDSAAVVANGVTGDFFALPTLPIAGTATVRALGLRYRHAVFAAANNRIYVGTATGGGRVLELDAETLATLRSVALPAVPGRLALSVDGTRLVAGMDGGRVAEISIPALSVTRQFTLPTDPYGAAYDRVYDLAVDPFDNTRVLVLAGSSNLFGGSGAVLLFQAGVLVQRDAPRYNAIDYGWGYYSPNAVAWTGSVNEFLAVSYSSPGSMYRFRTGAGAAADLAGLQRVEDTGLEEVNGEILTRKGQVLNGRSFATLRTLRLGSLALQACKRQTAQTALCQPNTGTAASPPYLALLDAATGDFLGAYKPLVTQVFNGCPEVGTREGSFGLDDAELQPMDVRRSLVTALRTGTGDLCSLQVWSLTGVGS